MIRATRGVCVALFAAALLCACSSDGSRARSWQSSMFEHAPPGTAAKVVVIRVDDATRYTPSQRALEDMQHAPGVMNARRGAGENELYALVDGTADPQALVLAMTRAGHRAWVVREVTRSELDKAEAK